MNNEPVAWMYEKPNGASKLSFVKEKMLWEDMTETPLYAHPAKTPTDDPLVNFKPVWQEKPELTLTDEEIHQVFRDTWDATTNPNCVFTAFARAILRKAQEK
jgi:hypothetical protein